MVKLTDIERKLDKVDKKMEETTLAMEMLKEMKDSNKRKDKYHLIVELCLVAVITILVGLYFWHENQYETVSDEETTQYIEDIDTPTNSNFSQTIN